MTPEQLIASLQDQIVKLEIALAIEQQNVKDFENIAIEWKKGYEEESKRLGIKLKEAEIVIEQLEEELRQMKDNLDARDYRD
jgi:hypothetical protein